MSKIKFIFMFLSMGLFFTSCTDDGDTTPDEKTIVDVVVDSPDFTLLEAAVLHAGIADALKSPTITVFAPTDAAFRAAGLTSAAIIQSLDKAVVANLLSYHVVGSLVPSTALATKDNAPVKMLNGVEAFVTKNASAVSINGATVTTADVKAENGAIIHVIDAVIAPETRNIVALAQGNADLSFLVAAVLKANTGSTKVVDILSGTGPFTVFAPTNDAFKAAGFTTEAAVTAADANTLAAILTYHVIGARVYSTNLTSGDVTTASGGKVTINAANGTVKGAKNTSLSKIIAVNIPASNGVVHLIDNVLLP